MKISRPSKRAAHAPPFDVEAFLRSARPSVLAGYGTDGRPLLVVPHISQETLADMIGTTRSPVNVFPNRFRKRGFIDDNGELKVNRSLLSVVVKD